MRRHRLLAMACLALAAYRVSASSRSWPTWMTGASSRHSGTYASSNTHYGLRVLAADGATPVTAYTPGASHFVELYATGSPAFSGFIVAPFSGARTSSPSSCASGNALPTSGSAAVLTATSGSAALAMSASSCRWGLSQYAPSGKLSLRTIRFGWTAPPAGTGAVTLWAVVIPAGFGGAYYEDAFSLVSEAASAPAVPATPSPTASPTPTRTCTPSGTPTPSAAPAAQRGNVAWAGRDELGAPLNLTLSWVATPLAQAPLSGGSVRFALSAPGKRWLALGRSDSGGMFGARTGYLLVGAPNATTAAGASVTQLWRAGGYAFNVTGSSAWQTLALSAGGVGNASTIFSGGVTTLAWSRSYGALAPAAGVVTDALLFDATSPQGYVYAAGRAGDAWPPPAAAAAGSNNSSHPLRGYEPALQLYRPPPACTPATDCGAPLRGACTPASLAGNATAPKCACSAGYTGAGCASCLGGYVFNATDGSCAVIAAGLDAVLAGSLTLVPASGAAAALAAAPGGANVTLAWVLASAAGIVPNRLRVAIGTSGTTASPSGAWWRLRINVTDADATAIATGATANGSTSSTVAAAWALWALLSGTNVSASAALSARLASAFAVPSAALVPEPSATAPVFAASAASATGASTAGGGATTPPGSSADAYPHAVRLSNGLTFHWKLDAANNVLFGRLAWAQPAADAGDDVQPWFSIAFCPSEMMLGCDAVVVEPAAAAAEAAAAVAAAAGGGTGSAGATTSGSGGVTTTAAVRRYMLGGYTTDTCPPADGLGGGGGGGAGSSDSAGAGAWTTGGVLLPRYSSFTKTINTAGAGVTSVSTASAGSRSSGATVLARRLWAATAGALAQLMLIGQQQPSPPVASTLKWRRGRCAEAAASSSGGEGGAACAVGASPASGARRLDRSGSGGYAYASPSSTPSPSESPSPGTPPVGGALTVATFARVLAPAEAASATTAASDGAASSITITLPNGEGSVPAAFAIADPSQVTITWAWGYAYDGLIGYHTADMSGAATLDLTTGDVRARPWAPGVLAVHVIVAVTGFAILLPAAALLPFASSATLTCCGHGSMVSAAAAGCAPAGVDDVRGSTRADASSVDARAAPPSLPQAHVGALARAHWQLGASGALLGGLGGLLSGVALASVDTGNGTGTHFVGTHAQLGLVAALIALALALIAPLLARWARAACRHGGDSARSDSARSDSGSAAALALPLLLHVLPSLAALALGYASIVTGTQLTLPASAAPGASRWALPVLGCAAALAVVGAAVAVLRCRTAARGLQQQRRKSAPSRPFPAAVLLPAVPTPSAPPPQCAAPIARATMLPPRPPQPQQQSPAPTLVPQLQLRPCSGSSGGAGSGRRSSRVVPAQPGGEDDPSAPDLAQPGTAPVSNSAMAVTVAVTPVSSQGVATAALGSWRHTGMELQARAHHHPRA